MTQGSDISELFSRKILFGAILKRMERGEPDRRENRSMATFQT